MMDNKDKKCADHKKRCQAMIDIGIQDPESDNGRKFCTNHCPYTNGCIVFEDKRCIVFTQKKTEREREAKSMRAEGYSVKEIANHLRVTAKTVERYLESNERMD